MRGEKWRPFSPSTFVTPPFPGYVSGHSTVSAACAKVLELFTGSDRFGTVEKRRAGEMTEPGASYQAMQGSDGQDSTGAMLSCDVTLQLPTFSATAEMAGFSRVLGGYRIQADNQEGLKLGRKIAAFDYPLVQKYFDGTTHLGPSALAPEGAAPSI